MLSVLESTHYFAITGSLVFFAVIWYAVQRVRYDHRIRKIGGVRAPSIGANPFRSARRIAGLALAQLKSETFDSLTQLFNNATPECPDCVEIQTSPGERFIITQDPEHIKTVLTTKFGEYGKGPAFHRTWRPFLGDSIFTTDKDQWHESRRLIRPMFVKDRISDLTTFERGVTNFIAKLPPSGQTVDIMDLLYRLTLDVTTDFLLGASANSLDNAQSEFARAFNYVQRLQAMMIIFGPFHVLLPRWRYNQGIKKIDEFVMPYIEKALALPVEDLQKHTNAEKHLTFLHSILQRTRNPKVLRDQIVAVLLAGRDTTAATLSWAFYELSHYPEKYHRLRQEILASIGRDNTPTYDDLKNMTYLRHVLNETLRLYPAVPYNIRTALQDTTLPGAPGQPPISVVEGDAVCYSVIHMHRRRELYPPVSEAFEDPGVFSPERWESWSPRPWQYVPFNGGPRICVGQNFAITEMGYCFRIIQKYERLEYRGDWHAQKHKSEIVGMPSQGVPLALYEAL